MNFWKISETCKDGQKGPILTSFQVEMLTGISKVGSIPVSMPKMLWPKNPNIDPKTIPTRDFNI